MNLDRGETFKAVNITYLVTQNQAGVRIIISQYGHVYRIEDAPALARGEFPKPLGHGIVVGDEDEKREPDLTPEKIYEQAIRDNNENLRWWKEGYGQGYAAGFDAGREYQLEQ